MSTEVKLPELGENVTAGDLLKLLVKAGDKIQKDQALMELETDKASIEVPSPVGGTVKQVHVKEGQKVKVGELILSVDENGSGAKQAKESTDGGVAQGAKAPKTAPQQQPPAKGVNARPAEAAAPPKPAPKASSSKQTIQFTLPELGENVSSGDLLNVLVKVGDRVEVNQAVLELETDKATIEVPSTIAGVVKQVLVKPGEKLKVGTAIFTAETSGEQPQTAQAYGETGVGGVGTGGQLPQEQPIGATTKETIEETPAPKPIPSVEAQTAPKVPDWENETAPPPAPDVPEQVSSRTGKSPADVPAGPAVRALAREIGVDITEVKGSGPRGRVTPADVKGHARRRTQDLERGMVGGRMVAAAPLPDFSRWGSVERKAMTGVRRKTAEHMAQAWSIPHVTNNDKADITSLEHLRKMYTKRAEEAGGKLTTTAIALKIVASALKQFPQFAASIDLAKEEIVYKSYAHIGVAVDTERGLLVPVIRDVDKKNIIEISVELQQIAQKARERKLKMEEMEGGVFTITNLGGIGGTNFTPIINSPEVAILGMMRSTMEPVYIDGKFEPRLMLPLSLSYDHRLIDGADAARFLRWVCEAFEQPFLLSLQG